MFAQWYHLGIQLKVRPGTLDRIRTQFHDPRDQLLEMLKTWLMASDNTSWKTLTDALKSRTVGANQLASVLETKYCLVEENQLDIGTSTSGSQSESNMTLGYSTYGPSPLATSNIIPCPSVPEQMAPIHPGVAQSSSKRNCESEKLNLSL